MEIIIGKTSGFCHGVKNAVIKAKKELEQSKEKVYCLGELVHNKDVIITLQKKGLIFIDKLEEAKGKTIIRAHGTTKETYKKAKELKLELKDLTCPKVLKIHDIAEEYSKNGYYIFLVGIKNHPETIGNFSFCGENSSLIENICDLEQEVTKFQKTKIKKALLISQTTFNLRKFEEITETLRKMLEDEELKVINTICLSTELRQKETENLSQNVDLMLIIGGKNSSNTKKLFDIASKHCDDTICIETYKEIEEEDFNKYNKIGIMAGASTPEKSIEDVKEIIKHFT